MAGRLVARGARVRELDAEVAALAPKAQSHDLILAGRWWRLRGRIDPAVRADRRLRRAIRPGAAPGI